VPVTGPQPQPQPQPQQATQQQPSPPRNDENIGNLKKQESPPEVDGNR
jgi:hypothetical protein